MSVKYINEKNAKDLINSGDKFLLNFTASWCGPCKMFAPVLEEVSNEIPVYKVDGDENPLFTRELNISGYPTTFLVENKTIIATKSIVGFIDLNTIKDLIK
ncbi:MAG: thioredoxin family protein [Mollicutes bacterium PWAP]|nr:thioredoxin family protein [Mollicutes bacterium PWAP]